MIDRIETEKVLNTFLDDVIKASKENLNKQGINASKDLYNSFKSTVNVFPNSIQATIEAEDYLPFIDRGVKGVKGGSSLSGFRYKSKGGKRGLKGMPPPSAFDKWNIIKGRADRDKRGRFLTRKELNFRTAVGVFNYGIKPTKFFTNPFEKEFAALPDEVIKAYGLDLEKFIRLVLKD